MNTIDSSSLQRRQQNEIEMVEQQQQQQPPSRLPSAALFERVAHYASPQPSPPTYKTRMRFRSSVAPSPFPSAPLKPRHTESAEKLVPEPPTSLGGKEEEEEGIPLEAERARTLRAARGERRGEGRRPEHRSSQRSVGEREEDEIKAIQKVSGGLTGCMRAGVTVLSKM